MGTLIEPVPVTGLAENFSPIPRMAPPPLGSDMEGGDNWVLPTVPPPAPSCARPGSPSVSPLGSREVVSDRSAANIKLFLGSIRWLQETSYLSCSRGCRLPVETYASSPSSLRIRQ